MRSWILLTLVAILLPACVSTKQSGIQNDFLRLQDIDLTFPSLLPSEIEVKSSGSGSTEQEAID